jgi:hypothetical protein
MQDDVEGKGIAKFPHFFNIHPITPKYNITIFLLFLKPAFMKTTLLLTILLLFSLLSFSQVKFENGYFVNLNNERTNCLIKNYDKINNPTEIEYKISENSDIQKVGISIIKEFGINGCCKFIRAETNIDRSTKELSHISINSNPEWSQEQLLLKVLVEGKASLYKYEDNISNKFFYSIADSGIKQLIYKQYLSNDDKYLLTNSGFRQQLWTEVKCGNITETSVENLEYTESALKKYFIRYNDCNGCTSIDYNTNVRKNPFHLNINSGITSTSVSFSIPSISDDETDFGRKLSFRLGIDLEYVLPFNKNKWRIAFSPSYQQYSSHAKHSLGDAEIKSKSIEFPLGLRYYFFLKNNLNIFIAAQHLVTTGINFHSTIKIDYPYSIPVQLKNQSCFAFGIGVNYKKLSSEIRMYTNRDLIGHVYVSDYHVAALIIGYKFF